MNAVEYPQRMRVIVDANILFAALIVSGATEELLFDERLEPYTQEFAFVEIEKYKEYLQQKSQRQDIALFIAVLRNRLSIVPIKELEIFARQIKSPDPDDLSYLAAAKYLRCPLWSNDRRLKEQHDVVVYTTDELSHLLANL